MKHTPFSFQQNESIKLRDAVEQTSAAATMLQLLPKGSRAHSALLLTGVSLWATGCGAATVGGSVVCGG